MHAQLLNRSSDLLQESAYFSYHVVEKRLVGIGVLVLQLPHIVCKPLLDDLLYDMVAILVFNQFVKFQIAFVKDGGTRGSTMV